MVVVVFCFFCFLVGFFVGGFWVGGIVVFFVGGGGSWAVLVFFREMWVFIVGWLVG